MSKTRLILFPPSLEDMIDLNHAVRVVSEVIDHIDMDIIVKKVQRRRYDELSSPDAIQSVDLLLSQ